MRRDGTAEDVHDGAGHVQKPNLYESQRFPVARKPSRACRHNSKQPIDAINYVERQKNALVLSHSDAVSREEKKLEKEDNCADNTKRTRGEHRVLGLDRGGQLA